MNPRWTRIFGAAVGAVDLAGAVRAQVVHFGSGCPGASGNVPTIDIPAHPFSGEEYYLDIASQPLMPGLLIVGITDQTWGGLPLPLDLGFVGLSGCELLVSPNLMLPFTTDLNGDYRLATTGLSFGTQTYVQAYVSDLDLSAGIIDAMSDGVEITGAGSLQMGAVVVTEIMVNPEFAATDADGEWFEVKNKSGFPINLEGWRLDSSLDLVSAVETHFIDTQGAGLIIPPEGYALLSFGPEATNGGVPTDYVYGSDIRFKNNGVDNIRLLSLDLTFIDAVEWDDGVTFPDPKGASMSLNFFHDTAEANDFGQFWCDATFPIGGAQGNTDLATPGAANPLCD